MWGPGVEGDTVKKLLKLALLVGIIAAIAKLVGAKKAEWAGLTEAEVRAKLDARLPDKMPPEKQAMVADKVVAKMRDRGVLIEDTGEVEVESNGGVAVVVDTDEVEESVEDSSEEIEGA